MMEFISKLHTFEFALGVLSLIGSYIIILSFILLKELRRHPYSLVFFLSVSDFIFVLVVVLKQGLQDPICIADPNTFCVGTFVLHVFGMASVSWGAMMSLKLAINTLRPFASTSKYEKFFHMYVWTISIITALISWRRNDGSIDGNGCVPPSDGITKQERVHSEFFVPLIVYFFLSVATFAFALARMRTLVQASRYKRLIIFRMAAYVIAIPVCWLGPLIYRAYLFFTTPETRDDVVCQRLNHWKSISLCLVGLVNASIWLSTPDFLRSLTARLGCCGEKADAETLMRRMKADVTQMNIVLRNNMLMCTLIGIRQSLRRLVEKRYRSLKYANAPSAAAGAAASVPISKQNVNAQTPLLYASSPGNVFKASEGTVIDMRSAAEETDSDDEEGSEVPTVAIKSIYDQLYNLRRGHYFAEDKFKVDPQNSEMTDEVLQFTSHFHFTAYAPKVFHNLRVQDNITAEHFMETMSPDSFLSKLLENEQFTDGGRSGSFFAASPCGKFIVKTIPAAEANALKSILPWYYEHLHKYPRSLLVRIYGLYTIHVLHTTLHVVVMSNLFRNSKYIPHEKYDLKGSTVDRKTWGNVKVKKDLDLQEKIHLGPKRHAFLKQLTKDAKLLRDLNIMDYSLLVGIHYTQPESVPIPRKSGKARSGSTSPYKETDTLYLEPLPKRVVLDESEFDPNGLDIVRSPDGTKVYSMGIIDILQPYNAAKKRERLFKVVCLRKDANGISAVPPTAYCRRFLKAISAIIE